jgi:hypothetical protein
MARIPHQLLELNSPFIWHWPWLEQTVTVAKRYGFTGIILHQQELLALLAEPSPFAPRLEAENLRHQRRHALLYLQRVADWLEQYHLAFWLQAEAAPPQETLRQKFPEQAPDGASSFWTDFYRSTLTPLLAIPSLRGLVLSLTTPAWQPGPWQAALQDVWRALRAAGKQLVLRDFIDASWPRQQLQTVLASLPGEVRASLKATELDYHPGFANHPLIATLPHQKWIEFDLWGIGYGWSVLPCYLADEIRGRLSWAQSVAPGGVEAVTARINWQWLSDSSLIGSVNEVNLSGLQAARLGDPAEPLLETWFAEQGISFRTRQQGQQLAELYGASADWLTKTCNLLGRPLHRQSQVPESLAQAEQLLHMDTRSARWALAFQPLLPADDPQLGHEQRSLIQLEKSSSSHLCATAMARLREIPSQSDAFAVVQAAWQSAGRYSQMFSLVTAAVVAALWRERYGAQPEPLTPHAQALERCADDLERWFPTLPATAPLVIPQLFAPERLRSLAASLLEQE